MRSHVASVLVAALAAASSVSARACATSPVAELAQGTYAGLADAVNGQDYFLGVPYAQPPVGSLRFAPPAAITTRFAGVQNATEYGFLCIGYGSDTTNIGTPVNEDCLTLNVVRPRGVKAGDKLPVGVWVHGGSYVTGGSRDARYNLTHIVQQSVDQGTPIVAVSINYRLQNWGFLFGKEVQAAGAGNVAFRDQRRALEWVRDNIAAFGGAPDKVTIWGESAGARSLGMQLIARDGKADGLFRAAILQSGSPVARFASAATWQPYFDALVERVGCAAAADRLDCLRALPVATLNDIFSGAKPLAVAAPVLSAVVDGDFITAQATTLLRQGKFARVPLLTGNNFDEGTGYARQGVNTDAQFADWLASLGLDAVQSAAVASLYPDTLAAGIPSEKTYPGPPPASFGAQFKRVSAVAGDYQQHAGRRLLAQSYAGAGLPVYSYLWNVIVNGLPNAVYGATHFQEVAFVFNNIKGDGYGSANPFANKPQSYVELADLMSKLWVAFIHDSDPNAGKVDGLAWPRFTPEDRENLVFDANVTGLRYTAEDTDRVEQIDYLLTSVF